MSKDMLCVCSAYSFDLNLAVIVGAGNLSAGNPGPVTVHTSPETQYTLVVYSLNRQPQQVAYGIVAYPLGAPGEDDSSLLSPSHAVLTRRVIWDLSTERNTIQHSHWLSTRTTASPSLLSCRVFLAWPRGSLSIYSNRHCNTAAWGETVDCQLCSIM